MTTIIVLFNLRPGVETSAYEAWAIGNDLPAVRALPSIERFTVLRGAGLLASDQPSPFQYVEIIEVRDMAQFGADVATDTMGAIAKAFQTYADNPLFIMTSAVG